MRKRCYTTNNKTHHLERCVQVLEKIVYPETSTVEHVYNDINISYTKKVFKLSNITYFGKEQTVNQFECEKFNVTKTTKLFSRMIMNGTLHMSSAKMNTRSCNYHACLANGQFIKIVSFLVDVERKCKLTLYQQLNVMCHKYTNSIKEILSNQDEIAFIETHEIRNIAVFVKILTKNYIIATPNSFFLLNYSNLFFL